MKKIIDFREFANTNQSGTFVIPEGIEIIEDRAFASTKYDEIILPDSVRYIGECAFSSKLKKITLSKNLLYIGEGAFTDCTELEEIILPESLEKIGKNAFTRCHLLKKIVLGKNLRYIGESAFSYCHSLEEVVFEGENIKLENAIFMGCKKLSKVTLPSKLEIIPLYAFKECESLKSIYLPDSIKEILDDSFSKTDLEKIDLSNLNIEEISCRTFNECKNLKEVYLPKSLKYLKNDCFEHCGFESLELPQGIVAINSNVFFGSKLKKIVLPNSLQRLSNAFSFTDLEEITIPENVESLDDSTFSHCKNLKKVKILSNHIKEIPERCFKNCGIEEFTIPKNIKKISRYAFAETELKEITIPENVIEMNDYVFDGCQHLESIIIKGKIFIFSVLGNVPNLKYLELPDTIRFINHLNLQNITIKLNTSLCEIPGIYKQKEYNGHLYINGIEVYPTSIGFKKKLVEMRRQEIRQIVINKISASYLYHDRDIDNIVKNIIGVKFNSGTINELINVKISEYFKEHSSNIITTKDGNIEKFEINKTPEQILSELLAYKPSTFDPNDIISIQKYGEDLNSYLGVIAKDYTNNVLNKKEIELELNNLKETIDNYFLNLKDTFSNKSILNYEELNSFLSKKINEIDNEIKNINQNNYLVKLYILNVQKLINIMEQYTSEEFINSNIIVSKINDMKKGILYFEAEYESTNAILSNYLSLYQILINIRDLYLPLILVNKASNMEVNQNQKIEFVLNNISEALDSVSSSENTKRLKIMSKKN